MGQLQVREIQYKGQPKYGIFMVFQGNETILTKRGFQRSFPLPPEIMLWNTLEGAATALTKLKATVEQN